MHPMSTRIAASRNNGALVPIVRGVGPQAARTALSTHNAFGRKCLAQNRATAGLNVETSGRLSSQTEKARLHTERLHALSVRERSAPQPCSVQTRFARVDAISE